MNESPYLLSKDQLLDVFSQTQTATAIHVAENAIIQTANEAMLRIWGKDKSVIGKSLEDALPELKGQPFIEMFRKVWLEGLTIGGVDTPADLEIDGEMRTVYFDFEYRAILDENGKTICILHTAIDVTDRFLKKEALERAFEKEMALQREQALNEELAASNEELSVTNEELQQTQESLSKLNRELEERVESRLKDILETEARFRTMAEGTDIMIAVGDESSNAVFFNQPWIEMTGRSLDELLEFGWVDMVHPEDRERYVDIYLSAFRERKPFKGEFRLLDKDGNYHWLLAQGPPRFRSDGSFAGYICSHIDITERKMLELELNYKMEELAAINEEMIAANEELQQSQDNLLHAMTDLSESEENLRLALEAAGLGNWRMNTETRELTTSVRFNAMYGFAPQEKVTVEKIIPLIDPEYRGMAEQTISDMLQLNASCDFQYPITHLETNERRWIRVLGRTLESDVNHSNQFLGINIDITEQKRDEQRKNDFIGMVSHELKTPLTSLNGYLQILQSKAKKADDTFSIGALETAGKQVKKMTTMINGFLNISRLESGKIVLDKNHFDLAELIELTVKESRILDSSHTLIVSHNCPVTIFADQDKISNVISNLLSNAMKYSPNNQEVEIRCELVNQMAQVSIRDKGIGINEQDIKRLFERYYRVEGNHTISGFGIGLYLSAEIIERHNGKIWVESEPGNGSTFYFSLPLPG